MAPAVSKYFLMKDALIITSVALTISLILFKVIKDLRAISIVASRLIELETSLNELKAEFYSDTEYLRSSKFADLEKSLEKLKNQIEELRNLFLKKNVKALLEKIEAVENDVPGLRDRVNERFFQLEKMRARQIFCDERGNDIITDEQLRAVLCNDDRSLVIAGAGSGKTRVIDFKVRYLVNYKKIDPSKILLLSFSKKSATDLLNKISKNVPEIDARTIHSFALQIVGLHGRKPFDETHKELESFVIKSLARALQEEAVFQSFNAFYERFFSDLKPLIFYQNLDELRCDLKKLNSKLIDVPDLFGEIKARRALRTLKGEYVRSVDERYIADFMYLHDVKYEYERRYPYCDELYFPDFYLPDYDAYLEHFAITATGGPPSYFDDPVRYMDSIRWKQVLHNRNKTRMIESYSYRLNAGDTANYLRELFAANQIEVKSRFENDEVYSKISREFCRVFTKFYCSFKLSGLSLAELRQQYTDQRYFLFLHVFERFLACFEDLTASENKIDFNDMIIEAVTQYEERGVRSFDYIIVDEFQDTSSLAMKLLDKVYQANSRATLFCVGDDWQSIYGFNGSDVTILSAYTARCPDVSVQTLNCNFRSHSRIVDLGKRFISRNPAQIQKNVVSKNNRFESSEIDFVSFMQMKEKINAIPGGESILVLYRYNDDCFGIADVLGDYFVINQNRKPVRKSNCTKSISMMTIHASKGLEARHVFVVFPDGRRRKFPSEIEDHFVFDMLKTKTDGFPFSEERRLMYVAITRAEQNLYFVAANHDPNSVFWDELRELVRSDTKASAQAIG